MKEKLNALKKKFAELPPAGKAAVAVGVGLLLFMVMRLFKSGGKTSGSTGAKNLYTESDGTIIYPYAVDYTENGSGGGGSSGGGISDGYYATTADLAAVVDAMTAGNSMLLERIDSVMQGTDVTNGNVRPQENADKSQAGILDSSGLLSAVTSSGSSNNSGGSSGSSNNSSGGSMLAPDGRIYATGGTGKQYVYNPATGNIIVDGRTVLKGSATYDVTYKSMLGDGVTIPGASAGTNGGAKSGGGSGSSKKSSSSGGSSTKTSSTGSTKASGSSGGSTAKTASDGKMYATGGSGKQYGYNPKTGNIVVNGRTVTKGSSTYNATKKAMEADTGKKF